MYQNVFGSISINSFPLKQFLKNYFPGKIEGGEGGRRFIYPMLTLRIFCVCFWGFLLVWLGWCRFCGIVMGHPCRFLSNSAAFCKRQKVFFSQGWLTATAVTASAALDQKNRLYMFFLLRLNVLSFSFMDCQYPRIPPCRTEGLDIYLA